MNKQELLFVLKKYNLKPDKGKGQHFLLGDSAIHKIITAAHISSQDVVIEVGPGVGTLTQVLCSLAGEVIAVELDTRIIPLLTTLQKFSPNLHVVQQDILKTDFASITKKKPYILLGNLPYNITSAILRYALEQTHQPERMVIMLQLEVGQRIMAKPGEMSLLALSVQLYGQPEFVSLVPRSAFYPQPHVTSMVMKIDKIHQPTDVDINTFFKLAHMGFNGKRKQLHNTLAGGLRCDQAEIKALLESVKIAPTARPQELSVQDWKDLANAFDHLKET